MTERKPAPSQRAFAAAWNRLVAVDTSNEEIARTGRLFNVTMVLTFMAMLVLTVAFLVAGSVGLLSDLPGLARGPIFPMLLAGLAAYCFVQSKRGDVWTGTRTFIWLNFVGLVVITFVLGGLRSPGWLLFLWPVTLAGMFIRPMRALHMAVGVIGYFGVLYLLSGAGIYRPPVPLPLEAFHFLNQALGLTMVVFVAGAVNYLNISSLQHVLSRFQVSRQELEVAQRTLERRVSERTVQLERRAEQLTTIAELNRAVASVLDLQSLFDTAVRLIADRLGYDHVGIFLVDPSSRVGRAACGLFGRRATNVGPWPPSACGRTGYRG